MMASILDIAVSLRNGKAVKQSSSAGGLPITRIETIADGTINSDRVGFAGLSRKDSEDWILEEGDILISHINSTKHLGKCAIYEGSPANLVHGMNLLSLRVDSEVANARFVYRMLASQCFRRQLPRITKNSVNQSSFNISNFKKLHIPLPPLDEQKRIAAILDAADGLRAKRREALDQLDALVQSTFLDMFGDPVENPMGWNQMPLMTALELTNGRAFKSSEWSDRGLPIIRIQNVKDPNREFNRFSGPYDRKHLVKNGDILLCWAGQLVSIGVFRWNRDDGLLNQHIFKVTPKSDAEPTFVMYMLQAVVEQAKMKFRGIEMKHLTKADLAREKATIPPLILQTRFAKTVEAIERQKARYQAHLDALDDLFTSLQQRAFAGEL